MKLVRILVLAVALLAGGGAAYLALNMGGQSPTPVAEAPKPVNTQDVLVATSDIGQGQKLSAANVRWQLWPEEAVNAAYIKKAVRPDAVANLDGSIVRTPFVAGEPIREGKLSSPGSGFMSAILGSGRRAIAVRIAADTTAGGFILPNDRVDVVQTVSQGGTVTDQAAKNVSRTILTNVKVLAIDQTVDDQNKPKAADGSAGTGETVVVGKTATLELDPVQVELITAAEASGTLSLALRSMSDTDETSVARQERETGSVRVFRFGKSTTVSTK